MNFKKLSCLYIILGGNEKKSYKHVMTLCGRAIQEKQTNMQQSAALNDGAIK